MSDSPKISVIVPVYNVEKYLDNCLESIVNQTYKNLEIILVDDGSPDSCPQMCDAWAEKDERIKVIHKQNGGVSTARNAGLDAAKGDFVTFVDADDYIDSDMYEAMLSEIIRNNADAASCGMVRESANGYKEHWGDDKLSVLGNKDLLKLVGEASGILPVSVGNKLFSRSCVESVRFDTRFKYAEDTLFNFQAALNIDKMVVHNLERYHYINNDSSASHKTFNESRFDEHRVMDVIFSLTDDEDVLRYCVKGDVLKTFRTIKRMCISGNCLDEFKNMRKRIIAHKNEIFKSGIYSKATKAKTAFLWLFPNIYKQFIKAYGLRSIKNYDKLTKG